MGTVRQKLSAEASVSETLAAMAEGHARSVEILFLVFQHSAFPVGVMLDLDDMNIRGRQIRHAFEQVCGGRIDEFVDRVTQRDPALVQAVNCITLGRLEHAVCRGGSNQHRSELLNPVS